MTNSPVATGLSSGGASIQQHAERAVARALDKIGTHYANSVLLFLTSDAANDPEPALRTAAKTAGCTQVFGCTASGILTDDDWVMDNSGAAAMVFSGALSLSPQQTNSPTQRLSFSTPNGLALEQLEYPVNRIGAISSDDFGHGSYAVWNGARQATNGFVDCALSNCRIVTHVAQGITPLTAPMEVAEVDGMTVKKLGKYPALSVLVNSLPSHLSEQSHPLTYMFMGGITYGESETAIEDGRYRLDAIISTDPDDNSITLSQPLEPGERVFWAMRDHIAAEKQMKQSINKAHNDLDDTPDFGLMFPCISRGAAFYGDSDRDYDLLKNYFPNLPFIGIYGNGEIAPDDTTSRLHQYSTVLSLCKAI